MAGDRQLIDTKTKSRAKTKAGHGKAGHRKAGKQKVLSNFPTASTIANYNRLWDTHSESKVISTPSGLKSGPNFAQDDRLFVIRALETGH